MGLPRINMALARRPWPCPRAKWHPFGFDASMQYGGRTRPLGASLIEVGGALGSAPLFTSWLRMYYCACALAAAPLASAACDSKPRGSCSTTPFWKMVTPTPVLEQIGTLPLSGLAGSVQSGCDSTLTRKRRGPGQWGLRRGYGGSRLQGKY